MFGLAPFLCLIYVFSISADELFQCAITLENNNANITCERGIVHCLTFFSRKSENHEYVQQGRGCMSWNEMVRRCPSTSGTCHILYETRDSLNKTCCCQGNMCNNQTLQLVVIGDNYGPSASISENLANFGLLRSTIANDTINQTINTNALYIGALCFVVFLLLCLILVAIYRICAAQGHRLLPVLCCAGKRNRILSTEKANGQINQTHTIAQQQRKHSLYRTLFSSSASTTAPLLASNQTNSCQDIVVNRSSSTYPFGNNPSCSVCPAEATKIRSAEKLATQHIVNNCQKAYLLGRGRFAEVWSASLPTSAIKEAASNFSTAFGSCASADNSTSHPDRLNHFAPLSIVVSETKAGVVGCSGFDRPVSTAKADEHESCDSHLDDGGQIITNEGSVLHKANNSSLGASEDCHDVAIKVFPASEQRAWLAELAIFQALQEPIGHQLLSSIQNSDSFTFTDLSLHSRVAATQPIDHTTAPTRFNPGSPSVLHSATSPTYADRSGAFYSCSPFRQSRRINLVQMLAAGAVTAENKGTSQQSENTLLPEYSRISSQPVWEYRIVLEYAAGGSLRSLLASGQWLSINRLLRISRDIIRGLSFMHSDVPLECSAMRGSMAKLPIAHRDLKPENILLRADGSACLSDFGQATIITDAQSEYRQHPLKNQAAGGSGYWSVGVSRSANQNACNTIRNGLSNLEFMSQAGTLRYMAPELLDGAINFTGTSLLRTDIYSLGLVLWELLTAVYVHDQPALGTPGPSHRQAVKRQHGATSGVTWLSTCERVSEVDTEDEEGEVEHVDPVGTPGATGNSGVTDDFGYGSLMLTGGWHSDNISSVLATQQHSLPSPPDNSRRHRHYLPYELELTSASGFQQAHLIESSCLLRQLVVVDKYRPMANYLWIYYPVLSQLYRTVTECWDPEPEARLTADCILERINLMNKLLKRYIQLNNS